MSKLYTAFVMFAAMSLFACTSIFGIKEGQPAPVDGNDSGTVSDAQDSGISYDNDAINYFPDTGTPETMAPPYVECVEVFTQPLADVCPNCSSRAKKCLTASFCIDSTGATVSNGFIDGCQAGYPMPCTFKKSCNDMQSYCLPMNDNGTSREYWGECAILVAFMAVDQYNDPVSQYAGYDSCLDSSGNIMANCPTDGSYETTCTTTYSLGSKVSCPSGMCLSYSIIGPDGGTACQSDSTGGLPRGINIDAFYLTGVVDPSKCNDSGIGNPFAPCFVPEF